MIINKGSFIRRQYVIPIGSRIIKSLIGRFLGKFMWFCGFSDCREQFYLLKNRNNEFYRLRRSFWIEKTQIMPIREQILWIYRSQAACTENTIQSQRGTCSHHGKYRANGGHAACTEKTEPVAKQQKWNCVSKQRKIAPRHQQGIQKYWGYRRYPQYRIKNPPAVQNRRCRLHEDTCRCFVL